MTKNLGSDLSDESEAPAPRKRGKAVELDPNRRVKIVLEENDAIPPTGQFFALNGRGYMLRPGVPAEVPYGLVNILNDAVEDAPDMDPFTNQVRSWRPKLRFPYRVIQ